ncbi:uncharacterized protein LOC132307338 isoform X2 [Cornus florida]|uniref:uncharacterized protein LOC132307338 isoform X2 n=1 Tax=Cornus florida TaxID=4283 RepID=UPI00289E203A|nr:uncharacterized protein LOC132307338 isoform X2 [Cornus florida]
MDGNEMKSVSTTLTSTAMMLSPVFLWRFKIGWDSVMRMRHFCIIILFFLRCSQIWNGQYVEWFINSFLGLPSSYGPWNSYDGFIGQEGTLLVQEGSIDRCSRRYFPRVVGDSGDGESLFPYPVGVPGEFVRYGVTHICSRLGLPIKFLDPHRVSFALDNGCLVPCWPLITSLPFRLPAMASLGMMTAQMTVFSSDINNDTFLLAC